jgi:ADP-ribose pyrophosphatase YjhB (NUDIX family)
MWQSQIFTEHATMLGVKEFSKDRLYGLLLRIEKIKWFLFRPDIVSARIMLVCGDKVLLVQHRGSRTWNLPGGGVPIGEDPELGALRELREETQMRIDRTDGLLHVLDHEKRHHRSKTYVFIKLVECEYSIKRSFEIRDAAWVSMNALPEKTSAATRQRIFEYQAFLRNARMSA